MIKENGFYIRTISNSLKNNLNSILSEHGITNEQGHILLFLLKNTNKTINQKDIEKNFNLKNSTISGVLKRLETKKLIKRTISIEDNRYKVIEVTDYAYELKNILDDNKKKLEECLINNMSDEEKIMFNCLLEKAAKSIERCDLK